MSTVPPTGNTGGINIMDLSATGGSVQMKFAALQMLLAQTNKEKAMDYMDEISSNQQKVKECSAMISKARELQNSSTDKSCTTMPDDMVKYFKDNNLTIEGTGSDNRHLKTEWDYNIKSLTNHQETLGTNTQQLMIFVQDFMGQYNSFLTGANSAIQQSNQTLGTIARGQ
jgi:hypothetical protein